VCVHRGWSLLAAMQYVVAEQGEAMSAFESDEL
jgi:hypothetical protein